MIPENKKAAVSHALQVTFGVHEFDDLRELTAGLSSALVFKMTVLGKPYLLRIITRTDAMADPANEYACMKAAADVGIAPYVWYTSVGDRIAITDFIAAKPFELNDAKVKIPALLRKLHALPPFPFRMDYIDKIGEFIEKFQTAEIMPADMTASVFDLYKKIKDIYPRNAEDLVACHNDLKPENTLFDGERVWLVDWEAAFLNDRYVDLAIAANFVVRSDEDEAAFLKAYFGEEASEYQQARFFLMRQLLHLFYFIVFMLVGKTQDRIIDFNMPKPGFREFHDRIWAGEISLAEMDARLQYALLHRDQLLDNMQTKRLKDSLELMSRAQ
ncbi:phosphotransferase [Mucilaginibacter kameinonensis]|uniref:phosphotransferase n=1 Tax=Mucilaginibacter kameinonensis TaxID=452286 RepID=UPI000EF7EAAB|nr:phosphotransferase [Mucilaginibacter kameinonensis]